MTKTFFLPQKTYSTTKLSKFLARKYHLFVDKVCEETLSTRGLFPLTEITQDILYHLYPQCKKIEHQQIDGKTFWLAFFKKYTAPEKSLPKTARLLAEHLLEKAVGERITDIHLSPTPSGLQIRLRRDGLLMDSQLIPAGLAQRCLNRFKILGGMKITHHQTPQDGRFSYDILGKKIDCRLSTHPTVRGEKLVLRILDPSQAFVSLSELGFQDSLQKKLQEILQQPSGLFVVTGPTGAGKTTTLYAILQQLNQADVSIATLESPVEYALEGITQTEAERKSINYTQGLRSLLRQDPDIILIGEIRDEETAQMALRAAMTGHKILTTFHTEDVFGVIPRLQDLGVDTTMIAQNLIGILSQRLVRISCQKCQGSGCTSCHNTGYHGRHALGEVLTITAAIKEAMMQGEPLNHIKEIASKENFSPLMENAQILIKNGITTPEEITRILGSELSKKV